MAPWVRVFSPTSGVLRVHFSLVFQGVFLNASPTRMVRDGGHAVAASHPRSAQVPP